MELTLRREQQEIRNVVVCCETFAAEQAQN